MAPHVMPYRALDKQLNGPPKPFDERTLLGSLTRTSWRENSPVIDCLSDPFRSIRDRVVISSLVNMKPLTPWEPLHHTT